jgi:hypothetical protein
MGGLHISEYPRSREFLHSCGACSARPWRVTAKNSPRAAKRWKALPTPNALRRIDKELRRQTGTQVSLSYEEALLLLPLGLLRSGQLTLRCLVGWHDLANNNSPAQAA